MKLLLTLFVTLIASFSSTFASDNNKFEGWSVEALTGSISSKAKLGQLLVDGASYSKSDFYLEDSSATSTPIKLNLIYSQPINSTFLIAYEFSSNAQKSSVDKTYGYSSGVKSDNSVINNISSQFSLSILPGYIISENFLVFSKLGYASSKYSIDVNTSSLTNVKSPSLKGTVLGIGSKYNISKNLYTSISYEYTKYKSTNFTSTVSGYTLTQPIDVSTSAYLIGIGYKF